MSKVVFQIRRKVPWHRDKPVFSYLWGDSLAKALSDTCFVSLEIDGQKAGERQTSWGDGLPQPSLLSFIGRYRNQPGSTRPEQNIREGLHHFLSAGRFFDGQLAAAIARDISARQRSEIFIRGDSSSFPLIINIPWELAEGVTISAARLGQQTPLIGTLASFLLARVVSDTAAQLNPTTERLRVLYCISQPPDETEIKAASFHEAIEATLKARPRLRYSSVLGGGYTPKFSELKAEIEEFRPNILIMVCHGQTLDGVPQLRFEKWHPVGSLADALMEHANTFLTLLIACDQTHLDERPAAHSGAVTLIEKGILSVVAMQSSVNALLAKEFLGTTLDRFFESGVISLSVAEGRKSMAPTQADAEAYADWSFPALFLTEDAPRQTDKLATIIEGFIPSLEAMLFRIPLPDIYLQRMQVDKALDNFLKDSTIGLREVTGGIYSGKTTAVCHAARRALQEAIAMGDKSARPVLYVDFGRYPQMPSTARDLMETLRKQTEEIQSSVAGMPVLEWTTPRGADGEGQTRDLTQQLLHLIDQNKMVLILDNLQEDDESFWPEFYAQAKGLNHSLVIRVSETALKTSANSLPVLPFSLEETIKYVESFVPQESSAAASWYDKTAGLPGMLELLRRVEDGGNEVGLMASSGLTRNLSQSEQQILYTLVHLPNGVDSELASAYVAAQWRDLLKLAQRGLLLREARFNITSPWFRLPQILRHALRSDEEKVAEAARALADRFLEQVGDDNEDKIEENCVNLAKKPGGIDFLQDIHQVFLSSEYREQAHYLPLFLDNWLFSNGRWYEAYRLWERVLTNSELDETSAYEWLRLAKAAHVLGLGRKSLDFIELAEKSGLSAIDEIDARMLRALLIKDSGDTTRKDEASALYDGILRLIDECRARLSSHEENDFTLSDLEERHAAAIYNRALHRRYWLRDLDGALADLAQAALEYAQVGNERMKALADCEWVDIQLDWPGREKDWNEMLERLVKAGESFSKGEFRGEDSPGDRAFCYYQMARYYRRKPFATEEESRENIAKARDAYKKASEQAGRASDVRVREITEGHLVEVSWRDLGEMNAAEAEARLGKVTDSLKSFVGDVWSMRVLRDMLFLRSYILRDVHPEGVLPTLREAWEAARQPPLHPGYGADAHRAARILCGYLEELNKSNRQLEADEVSVIAREFVEQWLGHTIDPVKRQNWISEVKQFGRRAGEYYGQPKR